MRVPSGPSACAWRWTSPRGSTPSSARTFDADGSRQRPAQRRFAASAPDLLVRVAPSRKGGSAMKRLAIAGLLAVGGACTAFAQAPATDAPKSRRDAASAWSEEGLSKVAVKGLDVVYAKPGATLANYHKVMLAPISVA